MANEEMNTAAIFEDLRRNSEALRGAAVLKQDAARYLATASAAAEAIAAGSQVLTASTSKIADAFDELSREREELEEERRRLDGERADLDRKWEELDQKYLKTIMDTTRGCAADLHQTVGPQLQELLARGAMGERRAALADLPTIEEEARGTAEPKEAGGAGRDEAEETLNKPAHEPGDAADRMPAAERGGDGQAPEEAHDARAAEMAALRAEVESTRRERDELQAKLDARDEPREGSEGTSSVQVEPRAADGESLGEAAAQEDPDKNPGDPDKFPDPEAENEAAAGTADPAAEQLASDLDGKASGMQDAAAGIEFEEDDASWNPSGDFGGDSRSERLKTLYNRNYNDGIGDLDEPDDPDKATKERGEGDKRVAEFDVPPLEPSDRVKDLMTKSGFRQYH